MKIDFPIPEIDIPFIDYDYLRKRFKEEGLLNTEVEVLFNQMEQEQEDVII